MTGLEELENFVREFAEAKFSTDGYLYHAGEPDYERPVTDLGAIEAWQSDARKLIGGAA